MSSHMETGGRTRRGNDATRRPTHPVADVAHKPKLLFFYSPTCGQSRRAEGFLAQVLQRRRNHETFSLLRIEYESRRDLAARCGVERAPAIIVVEGKQVRGRLEHPRGCTAIQELLAPWLI